MKKYKLTEKQLRRVIKNALMEGPFGLDGDRLKELGLTNPGDSYNFDHQELIQKCQEFQSYLKSFKEYIDGVDEEIEGQEKNNGVRFNVNMKNMWSDDWKIEELSGVLDDLSSTLTTLGYNLEYTIDGADAFNRYR